MSSVENKKTIEESAKDLSQSLTNTLSHSYNKISKEIKEIKETERKEFENFSVNTNAKRSRLSEVLRNRIDNLNETVMSNQEYIDKYYSPFDDEYYPEYYPPFDDEDRKIKRNFLLKERSIESIKNTFDSTMKNLRFYMNADIEYVSNPENIEDLVSLPEKFKHTNFLINMLFGIAFTFLFANSALGLGIVATYGVISTLIYLDFGKEFTFMRVNLSELNVIDFNEILSQIKNLKKRKIKKIYSSFIFDFLLLIIFSIVLIIYELSPYLIILIASFLIYKIVYSVIVNQLFLKINKQNNAQEKFVKLLRYELNQNSKFKDLLQKFKDINSDQTIPVTFSNYEIFKNLNVDEEKPISKNVFSNTNWSESDIDLFKKNFNISTNNANFLKKYIFEKEMSEKIEIILSYIKENPNSINNFNNLFDTIKNSQEIIKKYINHRKFTKFKEPESVSSLDTVEYIQSLYASEIDVLNNNLNTEIEDSINFIETKLKSEEERSIAIEKARYKFSKE